MPVSYDSFAAVYQAAGFHLFSKQISTDLARAWKKRFPKRAWIADLGAGDGAAVPAFEKAGFRVAALDLSLAMISRSRGLRIQGDMRYLPLRPVFHGAVCLYDAVNHLPRIDVGAFFEEARRILVPGAPFAVDANTLAGCKMWVREVFCVEQRNLHLQVRSTFEQEAGELVNEVSGWMRDASGIHRVADEVREWYHPRSFLEKAARKAGFQTAAVTPLFLNAQRPRSASKWLFEFEAV